MRNRIRLLILIVYVVAIGVSIGTCAEVSESALDSLRRVIQKLDQELASGRDRESDILTRLDIAEHKFNAQDQLVRAQKRRVTALTDSISLLETEVAEREARLSLIGIDVLKLEDERNQIAVSAARTLLAEHRLSAWSRLEFLLGAESWRELLARRAVLNRLGTTQKNMLTSVTGTADRLHQSESQLISERERLNTQRERLTITRREADRYRVDIERDARELQQSKAELSGQLSTVKENRELLEQRRTEVERAQQAIAELVARLERGEPLAGAPLNLLRGLLPWPVSGNILQKFGAQRNRRLDTVTENPGIDIGSNPDANVTAIADGRVSSVTWLRGFGNVCIIEHAGDFHSVYAKLGHVSKRAGEDIRAGEVIGNPGFDPSHEDYRVHFELWSGKTKLDPQLWLAPH